MSISFGVHEDDQAHCGVGPLALTAAAKPPTGAAHPLSSDPIFQRFLRQYAGGKLKKELGLSEGLNMNPRSSLTKQLLVQHARDKAAVERRAVRAMPLQARRE